VVERQWEIGEAQEFRDHSVDCKSVGLRRSPDCPLSGVGTNRMLF
jgi:hypothetical protein